MFKIGQRVVCIKRHSQNAVTVGKEYTIRDISFCVKCGNMEFDIGLPSTRPIKCACGYIRSHSAWLIGSSLFAPLEEKGSSVVEDYLLEVSQTQKED